MFDGQSGREGQLEGVEGAGICWRSQFAAVSVAWRDLWIKVFVIEDTKCPALSAKCLTDSSVFALGELRFWVTRDWCIITQLSLSSRLPLVSVVAESVK